MLVSEQPRKPSAVLSGSVNNIHLGHLVRSSKLQDKQELLPQAFETLVQL